jgi:hypothetical protein
MLNHRYRHQFCLDHLESCDDVRLNDYIWHTIWLQTFQLLLAVFPNTESRFSADTCNRYIHAYTLLNC